MEIQRVIIKKINSGRVIFEEEFSDYDNAYDKALKVANSGFKVLILTQFNNGKWSKSFLNPPDNY